MPDDSSPDSPDDMGDRSSCERNDKTKNRIKQQLQQKSAY